MMYDLSKTERQHLANQKGPVYSLIRKRCACGKVSTARQLRYIRKSDVMRPSIKNLFSWLSIDPFVSAFYCPPLCIIRRIKNFINYAFAFKWNFGCIQMGNIFSFVNRKSSFESLAGNNGIDYDNGMTFVNGIVLKCHVFNSGNKKEILTCN